MSAPTKIGRIVERAATIAQTAPDTVDDPIRRIQARSADRDWESVVPPRLAHAHIDLLDAEVRLLVNDWLASPPSTNLLILGPVGTGKTFAAWAAMRARYERHRQRPVGVRASTWTKSFLPGRTPIDISDAPLLLLDDVGAENVTDWSTGEIAGLLDDRWLQMQPTIVTSNLDASRLAEALGAPAWSRLTSESIGVLMPGEDRR